MISNMIYQISNSKQRLRETEAEKGELNIAISMLEQCFKPISF